MSENSGVRWVKENVEAVAIAVVMALVIRQFAIEAFKIPTESMAPTLLGDRNGGGEGKGDRILVDKIPLFFGEPERWHVYVFKYPLNASKNYIKRLIGLPGDRLSIADGDVFIDGRIARKPDDVQETLFFPVFPGVLDDAEISRAWEGSEDAFRRLGPDSFSAGSASGPEFLTYRRPIQDAKTWEGESEGFQRVGDVRLSLVVRPARTGGRVLLELREHRVANELVLAVGEGESTLRHGEERIRLPFDPLEPDEDHRVSLANVDDRLVVRVDGETAFMDFDSTVVDDRDHSEDAVRFGLDGATAAFSEVRIERDVYYVSTGTHRDVVIPAGSYFFLGDNSRSSADSREWNVRIVRMKDGTEYRRDQRTGEEDLSTRPKAPPGAVQFQDIHGLWRTLDPDEIEDSQRGEPAPFVPRENLIGRAFFVFWPLPPFSPHFRPRLIR